MLLDLQIALVLVLASSVLLSESRSAISGSRYDNFTWWGGWLLFAAALLFTGSGAING